MLDFSALTLLAERQEEHPACIKKLSDEVYRVGVAVCLQRCRLFAYGPADATACIPKPHHHLPLFNRDWFYLSGTGLPRLSWKRGR